jgi:hypothetical protein
MIQKYMRKIKDQSSYSLLHRVKTRNKGSKLSGTRRIKRETNDLKPENGDKNKYPHCSHLLKHSHFSSIIPYPFATSSIQPKTKINSK